MDHAPGEELRQQRQRVIGAAAAVTLLVLLPVLAANHLPLMDAPAHEARLAFLRTAIFSGQPSPFYALGSFFLPDIAFDAIGTMFVPLAGPEGAAWIFFALTLVLQLWGILILNRVATGRWSCVPLAAGLVLYSLTVIYGFLSFNFGLALVPWALVLRLRAGTGLRGFLVGAASGIVLVFCHVYAFAVYAVMAAGFALPRHGFTWRGLAEFAPPVALLLFMAQGIAGEVRFGDPYIPLKVSALARSFTSGSVTGDAAFIAGACLLLALIVAFARRRIVPSFVPGLLILSGLFFCLPLAVGVADYVDCRLPAALALLALAGLDVRIRRSSTAAALIGAIALAFVIKQVALTALWLSFDPLIDSAVTAFAALPPGSVVMTTGCHTNLVFDVAGQYRARQPAMPHWAAFAAFDGTHFDAAGWAIRGQQPIIVKPAYREAYTLQQSFPDKTCALQGLQAQLQQIRELAHRPGAPSYYLFAIRVPVAPRGAPPVARGRDFALYAVR
jgi:hypothetical protein